MNNGFLIKKLTLSGGDVPDASLAFCSGLNVVTGPSDTGKTFIAQCLAYALGAGTEPKDIPERALYDTVHLEIEVRSSRDVLRLERSLRGGDILVHVRGQESFVVKPGHQSGDENTLSYLLTDLCGLAGAKIRTNKQGKTRELSFRDLRLLTVIDEEKVISERSPVLTGQYTSRTAEISVFRLLLSGTDDSSVIEREQTGTKRARIEAKREIVDQLADELQQQLISLSVPGTEVELQERLDKAGQFFSTAQEQLAVAETSFGKIQEQRTEAWQNLRTIESRIAVVKELATRFDLLEQQYGSDLKRLECIAEAGIRLSEMPETRCPVCGALPEYAEQPHRCVDAAPDVIISACRAEIEKISRLTGDLNVTKKSLGDELRELDGSKNNLSATLREMDATVNDRKSQINDALQNIREHQSRRESIIRALSLHERLREMYKAISDSEDEKQSNGAQIFTNGLSGTLLHEFASKVEEILHGWNLPGSPRIAFDEAALDITMNGVARISHGKGVRAITHAAFVLALMRYCRAKSLPHPGTVIIDSPLVVYRDPDPGEGEIAASVKDSFYRSLMRDLGSQQAIIIENEDPPDDVVQAANVITFTAGSEGRRGFIPDARSANA